VLFGKKLSPSDLEAIGLLYGIDIVDSSLHSFRQMLWLLSQESGIFDDLK
jgi:hypothetical protein